MPMAISLLGYRLYLNHIDLMKKKLFGTKQKQKVVGIKCFCYNPENDNAMTSSSKRRLCPAFYTLCYFL